MSVSRRAKPAFVWSHYRITLDLYAINDNRVQEVIEHIDDFVGSLHKPSLYQLTGDDPCESARDEGD